MAPRTRSNMVEILAREELRASGHKFNTAGFAALPDELYLEIVSNLPSVPVPTEDVRLDTKAFRSRQVTLLSLSQTCRALRPVFSRYLYQRIEVYDEMVTGKGSLPPLNNLSRRPKHYVNWVYKQYAEELVRQLEIVTIRDSTLAQYVNILNVVIVNHSLENVMGELTRCIALFPNLHTVQLISGWPYIEPRGVVSFPYYKYPQIRNICITEATSEFLALCPNAQRITSYKNKPCGSLLNQTMTACPHVHTLGCISFEFDTVHLILKHFKGLNEIVLNHSALERGYDYLEPLSKLHLHTIRVISSPRWINSETGMQEKEWVSWAQKILLACPMNERRQTKKVLLCRTDGTVQTFCL